MKNVSVVDNIVAANITRITIHKVSLQANSIVTSLSSCGFIFMFSLLIFYGRVDQRKNSHPSRLILIFFGIISATITPLSVAQKNNGIYSTYLIGILAVIGIFLYIVGCSWFFEVSDTQKPICYKHPDVSLILWVVAIPLVLLELFETISALKTQEKTDFYFVSVRAVGLVQKLVQASFYHFNLRLKVARQDRVESAGWFLVIMSLFNYALWLDSIMTANAGTKYIVVIFGKGFSIVATACSALLIDYRLLCCLLFAEHALDMQNEATDHSKNKGEGDGERHGERICSDVDDVASLSSISSITASTNSFIAKATQMSGFGYLFGFICVTLQLVCGLQYAKLVSAWVNIFPILADVSIIYIGSWFIRLSVSANSKETDNNWRETHSKAIDVMVTIMGVVGFLFWFIKTGLNVTWATMTTEFTSEELNYLNWSAAKNVFRTIGILFQLYVFMKSDSLIGCRKDVRNNTLNFFLLPALMLSLLSVFITTIIDAYNGFIEILIEEADLNLVLTTLFKAGEPILLGFCLHVFLHFFIINTNMRNFKKSREIHSNSEQNSLLPPSSSNMEYSLGSSVHYHAGIDHLERGNLPCEKDSYNKKILEIHEYDNDRAENLTQPLLESGQS